EGVVEGVEGAAERLDVEAARHLLILHPQHHVVQPKRLEGSHGRRITSTARNATPASITMTFKALDTRCRWLKRSDSGDAAPAPPWCMAARAASAAGSTTTRA